MLVISGWIGQIEVETGMFTVFLQQCRTLFDNRVSIIKVLRVVFKIGCWMYACGFNKQLLFPEILCTESVFI